MNRQLYTTYERLLVVFVTALSVVAWVQARELLAGAEPALYTIFPLLGLLAFVLMWTHFVNPALRRLAGVAKSNTPDWYWRISTGLVLFLLIAHPLLLNIGLVNDGLGLPPDSYSQAYGAKAMYLFIGSLSLVVFLVFELHRWFAGARWWRFVDVLQVVAMAAIFVHALMLGRELTLDWYRMVWWLLGISLTVAVAYNWYYDKKEGKGLWKRVRG